MPAGGSGRRVPDSGRHIVVLDPDGREKMSDTVSGSPENAIAMGELLAVNLIRMGAARLLARNSPSLGSSH